MTVRQALPTAPAEGFRSAGVLERAGEQFRSAALGPGVREALKRLYHGALMLQTGGRGLRCALPGGEEIRTLPAHRSLSWNLAEYDAFRAATPKGGVVLDIGANVGAYALLFGQWVGPCGTVVAFEPQPEIHRGLAAHIRLNRLEGIVRPVAAAVSDRDASRAWLMAGSAGEARLAGDGERTADAATAPGTATAVVSLDRFCARERLQPDVIKIDVEGWELAVLRGARELIARSPDLALFVEMHPSIWPLLGVTRADMLAELAAQQLTLEPLTPAGGEVPFDEAVWGIEGVCVRLRQARCAS